MWCTKERKKGLPSHKVSLQMTNWLSFGTSSLNNSVKAPKKAFSKVSSPESAEVSLRGVKLASASGGNVALTVIGGIPGRLMGVVRGKVPARPVANSKLSYFSAPQHALRKPELTWPILRNIPRARDKLLQLTPLRSRRLWQTVSYRWRKGSLHTICLS